MKTIATIVLVLALAVNRFGLRPQRRSGSPYLHPSPVTHASF